MRSQVRDLGGLICATMRSGDRRRKEVRPSLKEIADRAAAEAERQAICLALHATAGEQERGSSAPPGGLQDLAPQDEALQYRGRGISGVVTRAEISARDCA